MFGGERTSLKADNGSVEPPSVLGFQFVTERQQRTSQFHIVDPPTGRYHKRATEKGL
jgi:hypothetical protein